MHHYPSYIWDSNRSSDSCSSELLYFLSDKYLSQDKLMERNLAKALKTFRVSARGARGKKCAFYRTVQEEQFETYCNRKC